MCRTPGVPRDRCIAQANTASDYKGGGLGVTSAGGGDEGP